MSQKTMSDMGSNGSLCIAQGLKFFCDLAEFIKDQEDKISLKYATPLDESVDAGFCKIQLWDSLDFSGWAEWLGFTHLSVYPVGENFDVYGQGSRKNVAVLVHVNAAPNLVGSGMKWGERISVADFAMMRSASTGL